jgi:hypothetical protein
MMVPSGPAGPVYYRYGLACAGLTATVMLSAAVIFAVGYVCAVTLGRTAVRRISG